MTLRLADVCDLDCVVSAKPLVLDLPSSERYVRGAAAIARRVLYAWCDRAFLLDRDGQSWAPADLVVFRSQLAQLAEDEDYVLTADVKVTLVDDVLTIRAALLMVDGRTYPLEVTAAEAVSVVFPEAA